MFFRIFIFSLYSCWILNVNSVVDHYSNRNDFVKYVIEVFNHIRTQNEGWDLKNVIQFKISENNYKMFYLEDILKEEVTKKNYLTKIPILNNLIVLRYTEVLKVFFTFLSLFISKCNYYFSKKEDEKYIACSYDLVKVIGLSKKMTMHLYEAANFLHEIGEKINADYLSNLDSLKKVLLIAYNYSIQTTRLNYEGGILNNALKVVENIKKFWTYLHKNTKGLNTMNKKHFYVGKNSVEAIFVTSYSLDCKSDPANIRVWKLSESLSLFYNLTIDTEFKKLGFCDLIHRVNESSNLQYLHNLREAQLLINDQELYEEGEIQDYMDIGNW